MRPTNNNNNTRRPTGMNNNNRNNPNSAGTMGGGSNGGMGGTGRRYNNNTRPSVSSGNAQSRTNAIYDRDEMSDIVNPAQRRHASNQQTKFLDLAKNAKQQGDRVEVEYYMQHVEHYTRILNTAEAQDAVRNQERHVRHTPQHNHAQNDDDNDDEASSNEGGNAEIVNEETEEQRLARVERNRAKRRNRRLKRNSYSGQVESQDETNEDAPTDSSVVENNVTEQPKAEIVAEIAEEKPRTPRIKRVPIRAKREAAATQDDLLENSGASLRDVLPSANISDANVNDE